MHLSPSNKAEIMRGLRLLQKGLEEGTLDPDEYILVGELLEWHQWMIGNRNDITSGITTN